MVRASGQSRAATPGGGHQRRWALLLVDFLNPLDFNRDRAFVRRAIAAGRATKRVIARANRTKIPVIYANDHWGEWTRNFDDVIAGIASQPVPGRELVKLLAPAQSAYTVLKPRHSAFYGTPLEFLLDELRVSSLIITGIAADNCVLFTASDAYLRKYELWVPGNCVAAEKDSYRTAALSYMERVLKARVTAA
jgi:nicotinamidase-related amidase